MRFLIYTLVFLFCSCESSTHKQPQASSQPEVTPIASPFIAVLGTIQDAGSPHIACKKECCASLFENPDPKRLVVSLGLVDPVHNKKYLFEATPDISVQVKKLKSLSRSKDELPDGIFLTHAHIGHYAGLMYLGKEATNADSVPVYTMPRMKQYLETNGPWDQLVRSQNIYLSEMQMKTEVTLTENVSVFPFQVPHRDEYSETVGYRIKGPSKTALFIPDIDKWEKWEMSITEAISQVDYAFVDATFYHGEEINTRDISQIPHPFIIESMELFKSLSDEDKKKVYFIHFNHTNPVLNKESEAYQAVLQAGFNIAEIHSTFPL